MATNIPPHNLGELCDALQLLLDNPQCSVDDLMEYVKGPDFPTAGFPGSYARGSLTPTTRAGAGKNAAGWEIEERKASSPVVIRNSLGPTNPAWWKNRAWSMTARSDGIADWCDESDRKGIRIVIDQARRDSGYCGQCLNSRPESSFGINMLAVVDNRPVLFPKAHRAACVTHRREVVIRRTSVTIWKSRKPGLYSGRSAHRHRPYRPGGGP